MTTKKTQVSRNQIRDHAVDRSKILEASIGTDEIIDGSVTSDKLSGGSVDESKLSDDVLVRILPETTGQGRDYQAAMSAATDPSEKNPFATMGDVRGQQAFWGTPVSGVARFSGDPVGTVRLDRDTGILYYKSATGDAPLAVVFDHSKAVGLEGSTEHQHVSSDEKEMLRRLVANGAVPPGLEVGGAAKFIVRSQDYEDVADGSNVLFLHHDLNDSDGTRTILLLANSDVSGPFSGLMDLGHGVWLRRRDRGSGWFNENDHTYFPDDDGRYLVDGDDQIVDNSALGMRVRDTESVVSSVERDETGRIVVSTTPPVRDRGTPMILTPIVVGSGKGFAGHEVKTRFSAKGKISSEAIESPSITSDGEGSYYAVYLDGSGRIRGARLHASGKFLAQLSLLPSSSGDMWPTTSFRSVRASMVIRRKVSTTEMEDRFLVISAVDSDGVGWILASSRVPRSTGSAGRSESAVSLSMSEARPSEGAWENHSPRKHEVYVVAQGQPEATAVVITGDDTAVVWTSVNEVDVNSSQSGVLSYDSYGSAFRGAVSKRSIELILRSAEGVSRWRRTALRIPTGKWGAAVEQSRSGGLVEHVEGVSPDEIDISVALMRSGATVQDVVVTTWISDAGLSVLRQQLDSVGATVTAEALGSHDDVRVDDLACMGGRYVHMISRGAASGGLVHRRISVDANLDVYVEPPVALDGEAVLSKTIGRHRVRYEDDDRAVIVSDTLQTEPLLGYDGLQFNEHDVALLCSVSGETWVMEAARRVRLRSIIDQVPSDELASALADQFKTLQSLKVWNHVLDVSDAQVTAREGAAASSIYDPSGNEWLVISGGVASSDRQEPASSDVVLVRARFSGSPLSPSYACAVVSPSVARRAYHGQCLVANANPSALPTVPGSSCFVFCIGGRREGGIERDAVGAFAENILTRILLQNMDDTSSDMSGVATSATASVDLTAVIPTLLKPIVFASWDGVVWRLVIVRAPRVWVLKESSPGTLFGATMPGPENAYEVGPSPSASVHQRSACTFFQENALSSGDYIWNPDMQVSRPGKTHVLCVNADGDDEDHLKVMTFDPANETNVRWEDVVVDSTEIPARRLDATLVWSGVKKGSSGTNDRQLLMMYGGSVGGSPTSEVWLLEYWRDDLNTPRAKWVFLTDAGHHGLAPAATSPFGARRPSSTAKTGTSDHAVYFGGGRLASGYEEPGLTMAQLPYPMKHADDLPVESIAMDMGGDFAPGRAYVVSEPIDLDNVQTLSGPVSYEIVGGANDQAQHMIRVAVGMDGTDQLHSLVYDDDLTAWVWTEAFSVDDMPTEACTLSEFSEGMTEAQLVREGTDFFTALSRRLHVVLMIPAMDPNNEIKVSGLRFLSQLQDHDANSDARVTWMTAPAGVKAVAVTPRSVLVRNDSGSDIDRLRVVVLGVDQDAS
jgi:hypothetical protein